LYTTLPAWPRALVASLKQQKQLGGAGECPGGAGWWQ